MAWRRGRAPYHGEQRSYENYYGSQVGRGMPVFVGAPVQRGHGLGNLFSGLVRVAMPLVKSGVKALAKQGMKTGMQIAGDVLGGQKPRKAAKRRAKQAGMHLIGKVIRAPRGHQQSRGQARGGRDRGAIKRRASSRSSSVSQSKRRRDIFG